MIWIKPNTITGSAAEGGKYYERKDIEQKLLREIEIGNHILFLAPRRVGKSSIVKFIAKNDKHPFACKYEDIESDSSIQDFYKRLCHMSHDALTNYGKGKTWLSKWWDGFTITSISKEAINIKKVELDYRKTFYELLNNLQVEQEKVVLFLDEFPDVVWKIYEREGSEDAETLLNDLRSLRQGEKFNNVFVMVLLGSVGLSHIVKKITGRIDKVNDLHQEHLAALKKEQASEFLEFLLSDATMKIDESCRTYLLNKIGHYIPYYIQLVIEECDDILYEEQRPILTIEDIDNAYKQLLKKHQHFEDWESRLSKYFPEKYNYLLSILSNCAVKGKLTMQECYDLSFAFDNDKEWKTDIDDVLIADGYIYEINGSYGFNSPLLRDWWKSRHPLMKRS